MLKETQTKALKIQFTIITESVCVEQCLFACSFTYRFKEICAFGIEWKNKYKEQYIIYPCSDIHDTLNTSWSKEFELQTNAKLSKSMQNVEWNYNLMP